MEDISRYNQIKIVKKDKTKTMFITHQNTFMYEAVTFRLKNDKAMVTLFHEMLYQEIKVYIDSIIAKSHNLENHLINLCKLLQCLRKFQPRLNTNKRVFGATLAIKLHFDCTNYMIEYEACIAGLQATLDFGTYKLEVFGFFISIVMVIYNKSHSSIRAVQAQQHPK